MLTAATNQHQRQRAGARRQGPGAAAGGDDPQQWHAVPQCGCRVCGKIRVVSGCCRFIDAASRYYELSSITTRNVGGLAVGEDDLTGGAGAAPWH